MQPATFISQVTGLPIDQWRNLVDLRQDADGTLVIARWDASLKAAQPSENDIAAALKAPEPATPAVVPAAISDRQFFQQLAINEDITQDEALAAVTTGTLPQKLSAAIAALPTSQQFAAKMLICGATQFQRSNVIVPVLGQALGKDAAALDALWVAAAGL